VGHVRGCEQRSDRGMDDPGAAPWSIATLLLVLLPACATTAPHAPRAWDPAGDAAWGADAPVDPVTPFAPLQEAPAGEASESEELAKKLSNPVADLISVPFQFNYDANIGPERRGHRLTLNVQPVVPFNLTPDWNLISRTILPLTHQEDIVPGSGTQNGLGDTTQSLFFSPVTKPGELIWGVGPAFLIPTGSDDELTADKWGLGPTVVLLQQKGPWTIGGLANHIWSVAGDDDRQDISSTFLQPFLAHTTKSAVTYTLNTESTYDWKNSDWAIPINAMVSKVLKIGEQRVSIGGGLRWWAESSHDGPQGLGFRFIITLLYPR
jgi:hypothetical protein